MPDINIGGHSVISRKEIPPYTIYERRPKPTGLTKYVVAGSPDGKMKDFGRYSTAIRWAKGQLPRTMPHVVIVEADQSNRQSRSELAVSNVPVRDALVDPEQVEEFTKAK